MRQSLQFGRDHRRHGSAEALLPQDASLDAGRAVGAGRHRHSRLRRAEGREARAHHLPRRHVSRDGARMRLQGRRDHDPHGGLYGADPRRLALHQPGQQLPEPDGDRQCLHVRLGRRLRLHGRGHDRQFRRLDPRRTGRRAAPTRSSPPRCGPTSSARRASTGRSRTTSISSAIAASPRSRAARGDCPYTFMQDLVAGRYRLPWEDEVVHKDGTACGFPKPSRRYGDKLSQAAE